MHILSPETDNCPSWISGRERMTVENISWSITTKECCRPRRGLNPRPPGLHSDGASNWVTEAGCEAWYVVSKYQYFTFLQVMWQKLYSRFSIWPSYFIIYRPEHQSITCSFVERPDQNENTAESMLTAKLLLGSLFFNIYIFRFSNAFLATNKAANVCSSP